MDNIHPIKNMTKYHISPPNQSGFDHSEEITLNIEELRKQMTQLKLDLNTIPTSEDIIRSQWKLHLLGTGAAIPSKYRNVTGMLLEVDELFSIMLDAGEGSLGQLTRKFTPDQLIQVLNCDYSHFNFFSRFLCQFVLYGFHISMQITI